MVGILKKLISFPTISQHLKENKRAIFWIKEKFKNFPLHFKYFEFSGHPSLLILTKKTKTPTLWLAAHIDVVPGPRNLFSPKIKGKKLIGRGAFDMKFAIACYLKLLEDLKNELKNYNFGIMITSDEEIGGFFGTKKILEKGFSGKVCFLPDGGQDWKFERGAKGVLHLKVECFGKSAHGSRPWEGEGANEKLIEFLNKLRKFFPKEPCKTKDHWHSTLTIGKIEGGKATNQVSDFSRAFLDIRSPSSRLKEKIFEKIERIKKELRGIKIEKIVEASPYSVDLNNSYLKLFSKIAKEKFKIKTGFVFSHGSSDARFFVEKKIPTILIRPKGGGHHSEKEWIDIEDLKKFYFVLKEFVFSVSKI